MSANDDWTAAMLEQVSDRFAPWLSCDDCFDRSDRVVDGLIDDGLPLPEEFRAHLAGCPACREELETLAELAALDRGTDPGMARAALDVQLLG